MMKLPIFATFVLSTRSHTKILENISKLSYRSSCVHSGTCDVSKLGVPPEKVDIAEGGGTKINLRLI